MESFKNAVLYSALAYTSYQVSSLSRQQQHLSHLAEGPLRSDGLERGRTVPTRGKGRNMWYEQWLEKRYTIGVSCICASSTPTLRPYVRSLGMNTTDGRCNVAVWQLRVLACRRCTGCCLRRLWCCGWGASFTSTREACFISSVP